MLLNSPKGRMLEVLQIQEQEKVLLEYLGEHDSITLAKFQEISKLNRYKASMVLVNLVVSNIP